MEYILKVRDGKFGYVFGNKGELRFKSKKEFDEKVDCFDCLKDLVYAMVK